METLAMTSETPSRVRTGKFTITIARSMLSDALRKLLAVVPAKNNIPILNCVLIDVLQSSDSLVAMGDTARVDTITLTGTNLDATVTLSVTADVRGHGSVALPAKRLADIVANMPAGSSVQITVDGERAKIKSMRIAYEVLGLHADEFPHARPVASEPRFTVLAAPFLSAVTRAAHFITDAESRPTLSAVVVEVEKDRMTVVATSGHILAVLLAGATTGATPGQYLLYGPVVSSVTRLFGGLPDGATLRVSADGNRALLEGGDARLEIRLVEGPYANYKQVIRATHTLSLVCDKESLAATLRRVALVSDNDVRRVVCTLNADGKEMLVRASTEDVGKGEDVVLVNSVNWQGNEAREFRIGVNAGLLLTAITAIEADTIELSFKGAEGAIHIRPATAPVDNPTMTLAMPLRLID